MGEHIFEEKKIQTQHKKSRIISGNTVVPVLSEAYHATSSIDHSKPMRCASQFADLEVFIVMAPEGDGHLSGQITS